MSNTVTKKPAARGRAASAATRAKAHPIRVPMSGSRKRMHIDEEFQDPNFHYAWINDQKDLIFRANRAGFVHVLVSEIPTWGVRDVDSANPTESNISMPVGGGITAYLMKQPIEFYYEDQEEMNRIVDAREAEMKKELNNDKDGKYGGVKFE